MRSGLKFFLSLLLLTSFAFPSLSRAADKETDSCDQKAVDRKAMEISNFMTHYYLKPQPELVGKAMRNFCELSPELKQNASSPFSAFLSVIFSKNPDKVPGWIKETAFKDQLDRGVVSYALWTANNEVCRQQIKVVAQGMASPRKEVILALLDKKPDNLKTLPIVSAADLDKLWAAFVASGDRIYVERIMSVLPEANGKGMRILIAAAAQWSLSANVKQHALVKQIAREEVKKHPEYKAFMKDVKLD